MKKICFITTVSVTLKTFVLESAKNLHEKYGHDITFICNEDSELSAMLPEYIHYIPVTMERGINLKGVKAIKHFMKIFKREKFDYIQYSTPNASLYASIASWLVKSPVRLYAQWGIRYVGANGFSRKILKAFEKITCMLSTHIRAVSHGNMQFALEEKLYKPKKVKVIGNGGTIGVSLDEFDIAQKQDLRRFVYSEFGVSDDDFVFGFVGRVSKDKGSEELIQAFKSLIEKGYKAKLFIVGADETAGMDEALIEWSRNSKDVIYAGKYPKAELIKFYSAFDCYVHPTYREGFGMVLQEAGAMGNAIITTNIPGASEVMEKDVSCKLVEPKDAESLSEAMEYMVKDAEKAKEIGENAYMRTKSLYERSIMLGNIAEDINDVIGE